MNPKKLFVTGGAGFIGSAVIRRAVTLGHPVLNFDKLTYAASPEAVKAAAASPLYRFVQGDVADGSAVRAALESFQPDAILHLAAESHVDRSIDAPAVFITTNVVGTFVMLEEARRYWSALPQSRRSDFRFIQVSTDEVFGSLGAEGRFSPLSPYAPNSPYSASKAAGDHLARAWRTTYELPVIVTNCSNNYGPFQFPEKLIPLTIERAISGRPIPVYGAGLNVRDWLYVDDHADGLLLAAEGGVAGETYLFGGGAERTNLDVVKTICRVLDELRPNQQPHERIEFVADRPGHDYRYAIDRSYAERALGWSPRHDFESGIRESVAWYLENRHWATRIREQRYAGERLGVALR